MIFLEGPKLNNYITFAFLLLFSFCLTAFGQSTAFNYQGKLTDGASAANGTYQMTFKLYDAVSGGAQVGSTITNNSVTVENGVFIVPLDFGAPAFSSSADRFLEIAVKKPAEGSFTTLSPRQPLTSAPYSLRTLSAASADSLSAACTGCVTDAQIDSVSGSKVTGTVASAASAASATNATNATNATSATTAGNVTGTVAVGNGGTGATSAANARTNLGLGTLATVSPTGTGNSTTFLRGDNTWAVPSGGGGGSTVELIAAKNALQTLSTGGAGATPDDVNFQNTMTSPTLGSWDGTTYTVGQTGFYLITVTAVHNTTSVITVVPQLLVNGTTVLYGVGMQNSNLTSGTIGRGQLTAVVQLTAGQQVKIKVANTNTSVANTITLTGDGTTRLAIVKL